VKAADHDGSTALIGAANQARPELVELLLDAGADVRVKDRQGITALLSSIDAPDHFSYREQFGYSFEISTMLIDHRADVNARTAAGDTPLLAALRRQHFDIMVSLLGHGADPNVRDRNGVSALRLAAGSPAAELLRKAGAKE
jgi:ankyrin repeat protein